MNVVKEFCRERYNNVYNAEKARLTQETLSASRTGRLSEEAESKIETTAQKEAIQQATIDSMRNFPDVEPADIWKAVYEVHVHRKSGIDDAETIAKVISADQSWKKSSGHAFEEMIKFLASAALEGTGIQIVLQRDLNILIKAGEINNEPRDISWLKEQIRGGVFDLYALVTREDGKTFCYGCIQSKTSVRDRVTRDREPSLPSHGLLLLEHHYRAGRRFSPLAQVHFHGQRRNYGASHQRLARTVCFFRTILRGPHLPHRPQLQKFQGTRH